MAVSGPKVFDIQGLVSNGSAEDFDHSCDPCLAVGHQHVEAHRFCIECQEYLCKKCSSYHQRIKASRSHQVLDTDEIRKKTTLSKDSTVCTEKCTIHKNEIVKFFCTNHEFLGCNDCITLGHRTCNIDYIPEKCANIGDSVEYRETLKEIDQKIKVMDAIIVSANNQNKELDLSHEQLSEEIAKFLKEINDHFDLLKQKLEKNTKEQKKETMNVIQTCTSASSDMKKIKFHLQESKACKQNGKMYILLKQAQPKLKTDDVMAAKESLEQANLPYIFERNKKLENFLDKQDTFGTLSISPTKKTSRKKEDFDNLTYKGNINVKTKSNNQMITGCAVLSSNKLVLADHNNAKLKVVDIEKKLVIEEENLDANPYDIAVLPEDQIAVTLPHKREILIMATAEKLSIIRRIPVSDGDCIGIAYHQDQLFVVCWNPESVLIADMQGNVKNIIDLENEIFNSPNYILLSEDCEDIYLSNVGSNSVVSVTLEGEILAVYKHKDLDNPVGMVMLDDGSLLVCCFGNSTIHHISKDLNQQKVIKDGFKNPHSICFNHYDQEIYIGGLCDQLMIMK